MTRKAAVQAHVTSSLAQPGKEVLSAARKISFVVPTTPSDKERVAILAVLANWDRMPNASVKVPPSPPS